MKELLKPEIQRFIKAHENDDPVTLIFRHRDIHGVSIKVIATQITARKKAKTKLPEWYASQGVMFPPTISMEQCSSEATAKYKASIVSGKSLIDLTGGAGVDTYYLSKSFEKVTYVEQNEELAAITSDNLCSLGATNIICKNDKAESFLKHTPKVDVVYLDPARRDENAQRVFRFDDCEPDVTTILPDLLSRADTILIKASPMLDIESSVRDLKFVHEIHIISVENECKEVLYLLRQSEGDNPLIHTINIRKVGERQSFSFQKSAEISAQAEYGLPDKFLYEPNSSILKAGAFKSIAGVYNIKKLHAHTHLYTSNAEVTDFPGRRFRIIDVVPYNKKAVSSYLSGKKANVSARNFPDEVHAIKKKLGLKDGGDIYLFAFTDKEENKRIAITEKP
ncbi:RsmD family RNA methyltransferase [Fulvivirga ulvae]|uniref:class I SAM-dependent methyltransferase n=1 Tax=Fulvivirga ulvae TaxID=2904245 RepID=UPI001F2F958F|nr:class I SAM-dependent methyltransferase [Fulvivirga ulvae]UII34144.1 RsmD family RNA methyltransferase [Fulvivirga ulvae]